MNDLINDKLARLLTDLENLPYMGRRDRFEKEVLETSGVYFIPNATMPGARYFCEITLHGIRVTGGDEADVITNWIEKAREKQGLTA